MLHRPDRHADPRGERVHPGPSVTSGRVTNQLRAGIASSTLQDCSREPTVADITRSGRPHVRAPLLVSHRYGTNM